MKIVYAGSGTRGKKCLESLIENNNHNVVGTILHENRDKEMERISLENKIPIYSSSNPNSPEFIDQVAALNSDIIVLSGYNYIVKKDFIDIPRLGVINLHGGKLPDYRGGSVLNWAIINNELRGACSIIYVDEGIDTGRLIAEEEFDILYEDTINDVVNKTLKIFPRLLDYSINKVSEGFSGVTQSGAGQYFRKRKEEDNRIQWNKMNSRDVYNLVRSQVSPCWGAFTYKGDNEIKIWECEEVSSNFSDKPGMVAKDKADYIVQTKEGTVVIRDYEGKLSSGGILV